MQKRDRYAKTGQICKNGKNLLREFRVPAALLLLCLGGALPANSTGFEIIIPHRAVYDVRLLDASQRSGIKSMNGRMVFEIRGNECEGISLRSRFLTNVTTARDQFLSDQHTSTFESPDGKSFNFLNKSFLNEQLERTIKGKAQRSEKGLSVVLEGPAARNMEFSEASFLTTHLVKMIEIAKSGKHYLRGDIFDGSDDGDEVVGTSSFISDAKSVSDSKDGLKANIVANLKDLKAWPVSMSYFEKPESASGERLPIFETSFLLFENGITSDLVLNYPDYTLSAKLSELELFEKGNCNQEN
jgi:hypothetical protein